MDVHDSGCHGEIAKTGHLQARSNNMVKKEEFLIRVRLHSQRLTESVNQQMSPICLTFLP